MVILNTSICAHLHAPVASFPGSTYLSITLQRYGNYHLLGISVHDCTYFLLVYTPHVPKWWSAHMYICQFLYLPCASYTCSDYITLSSCASWIDCHHVLPSCVHHSLSLTVASISGHFSPETARWLVVNVNDPLRGLVLNIANWQAAMIVGGEIGEEMYFCLIYSIHLSPKHNVFIIIFHWSLLVDLSGHYIAELTEGDGREWKWVNDILNGRGWNVLMHIKMAGCSD